MNPEIMKWLIAVALPVARPLVAAIAPAAIVFAARELHRGGMLPPEGVRVVVREVQALEPSALK